MDFGLKLDDVQFGFELEGFVKQGNSTSLGCTAAREDFASLLGGILGPGQTAVATEVQKEWHPDHWTVTYDYSLNKDAPGGGTASIEIKSPIIAGSNLDITPDYLNGIATTPLQISDDCGLHLHIGKTGGRQWHPQEVVAFMQAFEENIGDICALVHGHRLASPICKLNNMPEAFEPRFILDAHRNEGLSNKKSLIMLSRLYCTVDPLDEAVEHEGVLVGDRCHAVNLTSLFDKGTIEIKLRQAADYENATPFIGVMLHMAQASINGQTFDWDRYAANVANNPVLALPERDSNAPPRPQSRRPAKPVTGSRYG